MSDENGAAPEPVRYFMVRGKRYDMPDEMTGREFRFIKQETGTRAGEIGDEMAAGDSDLILCLVAIAMRRAGEQIEVESILDLKIGHEGEIEVMEEDESERPTAAAVAAEPETPSPSAAKPGRRRSSASTA
jgi:hypothetical protein